MLVVQGVSHIVNRKATLAVQARFRAAPTTDAVTVAVYPAGEAIVPTEQVKGEEIAGEPYWYQATMWVESIGKSVTGFFHKGTVGPLVNNETVKVSDPALVARLAEKDAALDRITSLRLPPLVAAVTEVTNSVKHTRSI